VASFKDLILAKDKLSERYLRVAPRRRRDVIEPILSAKAAQGIAGGNVHAVGVGRKVVKGVPTRTLCVRVYVVQKLAKSVILRKNLIPTRIAGLPTDVIESPLAYAHDCTTDRLVRQPSPIGGISAAHYLVNRATLGCFCHSLRKPEANNLYMLGNNHAFANINGPLGTAILQPSPGDGGTNPADILGSLTRFEPLRFGSRKSNVVDAAIAQVVQRNVVEEICMIGPLTGTATAVVDMVVCKHGRTTGYTEGAVVDVALDLRVNYGTSGEAIFVNQFRVNPVAGYDPFVLAGDSGSVIVSKATRAAVGLHFAGGSNFSVANPIADVCRLMQIRIP